MTQTQHKPQSQQIQLAPNQIYIKRPTCAHPIQKLVEGAPDWSFHLWDSTQRIGLYYKGRYVVTLASCYEGVCYKEADKCDTSHVFTSLADAAQHYMHTEYVGWIGELNQREGLEEWCIPASFTPAKLTLQLDLPPQERKRLERMARLKGNSLEELAMQALYAALPELEAFYKDFEEGEEETSA